MFPNSTSIKVILPKHINLHLDHLDNLRRIIMNGAVAELADAGDLKSPGLYPCGFDPHPPYYHIQGFRP